MDVRSIFLLIYMLPIRETCIGAKRTATILSKINKIIQGNV